MTPWARIETAPDEGEFLAYDPVARKFDVCHMVERTAWGADPAGGRRNVPCGTRWDCTSTQMDSEWGPSDEEFNAHRATYWTPLPDEPSLR